MNSLPPLPESQNMKALQHAVEKARSIIKPQHVPQAPERYIKSDDALLPYFGYVQTPETIENKMFLQSAIDSVVTGTPLLHFQPQASCALMKETARSVAKQLGMVFVDLDFAQPGAQKYRWSLFKEALDYYAECGRDAVFVEEQKARADKELEQLLKEEHQRSLAPLETEEPEFSLAEKLRVSSDRDILMRREATENKKPLLVISNLHLASAEEQLALHNFCSGDHDHLFDHQDMTRSIPALIALVVRKSKKEHFPENLLRPAFTTFPRVEEENDNVATTEVSVPTVRKPTTLRELKRYVPLQLWFDYKQWRDQKEIANPVGHDTMTLMWKLERYILSYFHPSVHTTDEKVIALWKKAIPHLSAHPRKKVEEKRRTLLESWLEEAMAMRAHNVAHTTSREAIFGLIGKGELPLEDAPIGQNLANIYRESSQKLEAKPENTLLRFLARFEHKRIMTMVDNVDEVISLMFSRGNYPAVAEALHGRTDAFAESIRSEMSKEDKLAYFLSFRGVPAERFDTMFSTAVSRIKNSIREHYREKKAKGYHKAESLYEVEAEERLSTLPLEVQYTLPLLYILSNSTDELNAGRREKVLELFDFMRKDTATLQALQEYVIDKERIEQRRQMAAVTETSLPVISLKRFMQDTLHVNTLWKSAPVLRAFVLAMLPQHRDIWQIVEQALDDDHALSVVPEATRDSIKALVSSQLDFLTVMLESMRGDLSTATESQKQLYLAEEITSVLTAQPVIEIIHRDRLREAIQPLARFEYSELIKIAMIRAMEMLIIRSDEGKKITEDGFHNRLQSFVSKNRHAPEVLASIQPVLTAAEVPDNKMSAARMRILYKYMQ